MKVNIEIGTKVTLRKIEEGEEKTYEGQITSVPDESMTEYNTPCKISVLANIDGIETDFEVVLLFESKEVADAYQEVSGPPQAYL